MILRFQGRLLASSAQGLIGQRPVSDADFDD